MREVPIPQSSPTIRGRCACGRRYRVRNARAGIAVTCPNCNRQIQIHHEDIVAASAHTRLVPVQSDDQPRDAKLVDFGELKLARKGSRIGLTGKRVLQNEEHTLFAAMRGMPEAPEAAYYAAPNWFIRLSQLVEDKPASPKHPILDFPFGFILGAEPRNFITLFALAAIIWLSIIQFIIVGFGPIGPRIGGAIAFVWTFVRWGVLLLPLVILSQYTFHVIRRTAFGYDRVSLFATSWDWFRDWIKPLFWIGLMATLLFGALSIVSTYAGPGHPALGGVLALAALVGPVALMSIALADSVQMLRPDWLFISVYRLGPTYAAVWFITALGLGGVCALWAYAGDWTHGFTIFANSVITAYALYVVCRSLGLLYRHHHDRLPWQI